MNNICLLAWLDDWHMSARLAKLSSINSYKLKFFENNLDLPNTSSQILLIIDIDKVDEEKLQDVIKLKDEKYIFILGYIKELDSKRIAYFRKLGYDMVLRRNKLLMNLGPIVKQITNAN